MKPGSIILIRTEGFLPDQIRRYMKEFGRQRGYKYTLPYNHVETAIMYRGNMVSVGARKHGAEMTPLDEYLKQHPNHLVLEPVLDLSYHEIISQEKYAEMVCFTNKRKYQYLNFLAWDLRIRTLGLLNLIGNFDNKVYCYELGALFAQWVNRWDLPTDFVSIYDLYECKHYKH